MNDFLQAAFRGLYPRREIPELKLVYSGRFKNYNATVNIRSQFGSIRMLEFRLAKSLKGCDESIQIGVIQHLLNKVYRTDKKTLEQELYEGFIDKVTRYAPKQESEPELVTLFEKLNEEYFLGMLERPYMKYGKEATTVLGHYNYTTDTVIISPVLRERPDLLAFVLYHELLHKKHGVTKSKSGRSMYHTPAFRRDEKKFVLPSGKDVEKELQSFVRKKKLKKAFRWF